MVGQSDAGLIARRQAAGAGVAGRLDHRGPALLKNHARENILAMRKKERQIRGQNVLESLKQPKPGFKLKQFENVRSRLYDLPRPTPNQQDPCDQAKQQRPAARPQSRQESQNGDAEEGEEGNVMNIADFELECERLKEMHAKKPGPRPFQKNAAGCPAYLQKIKAHLAEERQQAEAQQAAPRIPPGYRQMPEHERAETLEALQKKREELDKLFQRLPLVIETDAQKRRQKTVLDKIAESDKAIKTFSNPMVLVEA